MSLNKNKYFIILLLIMILMSFSLNISAQPLKMNGAAESLEVQNDINNSIIFILSLITGLIVLLFGSQFRSVYWQF